MSSSSPIDELPSKEDVERKYGDIPPDESPVEQEQTAEEELNQPLESLLEKKRKNSNPDGKNTFSSVLTIDDDPTIEEFEEFDGLTRIDLEILLPKSYFDAIDELSERIGLTIKQWINYAVIKEINALRHLNNHYLYSPVNSNFLAQYKIGQLNEATSFHIIKRYHPFSMKEVVLRD